MPCIHFVAPKFGEQLSFHQIHHIFILLYCMKVLVYMCICIHLFMQCPIVERLTNSLMMHGRNNGKKLLAIRIVQHAFEIIHLLTGEVQTVLSMNSL